MKKFSKILTLLLSLVLIVTAFTVVSLAEETPERSVPVLRKLGQQWDTATQQNGMEFGSGTGRYGYIYTEISDDQNKYAVWMPNPNKDRSNGDSQYYGEGLSLAPSWSGTKTYTDGTGAEVTVSTNTYNPAAYPYMVYEFDTMTPTGTIYHTNGKLPFGDMSFRTYKSAKDNYATSIVIPSTQVFNKIDTTPYNWQHITLVVKYLDTNVDKTTGLTVAANYEIRLYIDGVYKSTLSNVASDAHKNWIIGTIPEAIGYTFIRQSAQIKEGGDWGKDIANYADHPMHLYDAKIAYDNATFAFYKSDWEFDDIAADRWAVAKDLVPADGAKKSVAAVIKGDGTYVYYSSVKAAFDAVNEGETVKLYEDVTEYISVDKAITIDVGKRYNGVLINNDYKITFLTQAGYFATYADGYYTFAKSDDFYTVNWDPACEGECNCHEAAKHLFKGTTLVKAGETPTSIINPVIPDNEGLVVKVLGWKTSPNGETIQLTDITAAAGETVTLYPVYDIQQYDILVVNPTGSDYYYAKDFGAQLTALATSGGTIKLFNDITTGFSTITIKKSLTIDLNGHDLKRCFVYGNVYEATKNGEEFVYGTETLLDTIADTSATSGFYTVNGNNVTFTVTSTAGGGNLYNFKMKADIWKYNGEIVKQTSLSSAVANFAYISYKNSQINFTVNFNGGFTVYAGYFISQDSASASKFTVKIDNISYYKLSGADFITLLSDQAMDILISNSLIYTQNNAGKLLFVGTNYTAVAESRHGTIIFRNCDIFKAGTGYGFYIDNRRGAGNTDIVFDDCRLYDAGCSNVNAWAPDTYAINGTLAYNTSASNSESNAVKAGEGFTNVAIPTVSKVFYVPAISVPVDTTSAINVPTFVINHSIKHTIYFNDVATKEVQVTFMVGDKVESTETLYPGAPSYKGPEIKKVLDNDAYRDLIYQWVDEKGVLMGEDIDWNKNSYTYYAAETVNGVSKYVAGLKDVRFNLTYYGHLAYNLYTPAVEGVTLGKFGDYNVNYDTKIMIDGKPYWTSNAGWITPQTAIDLKEKSVVYAIDGVEYRATLKISSLVYAELLCELYKLDLAEEVEVNAIKALLTYIEEIYEYTGKMTEDKQAAFDSFFTTYNDGNRPAYITNYPESEVHTVNEEFEGLVSTIGVMIAPNNRVAICVTLTKEATAAGNKVVIYGAGGNMEAPKDNGDGTVTYYTNNNSIYGLMAGTQTITILDASGKAIATTSYSLATYIKGIEGKPGVEVAQALYTFGVAARNARNYLSTK